MLDSGGGRKLERFGHHVLIREEPKAWWKPAHPELWSQAQASFGGDGRWQLASPSLARTWTMRWGELNLEARLTDMSKHVGLFPEQEPHWTWMGRLCANRPGRLLNLFGYTGVATLAAARAGWTVTHLDASRPAVAWARRNQELSRLDNTPVRWILDDASKFVGREIRRQQCYDAIILDPPSFGRGPHGEIWKVEAGLGELLEGCRRLLSDRPRFVILTVYNLEASALMLENSMGQVFGPLGGTGEAGELALAPSDGGPCLPLSLYCRWEWR